MSYQKPKTENFASKKQAGARRKKSMRKKEQRKTEEFFHPYNS